MKEVFEKIRERLKNELHLAQEDCERYLNGNTNQFLYARARGYEVAMENAIEIVDQVAAECGTDVVYNIAMSYAICLSKYGVDITEKLETATQNAYALNQAYMRGRQDERDRFAKWQEEFATDINVGNKDGWIPCSERLPEEEWKTYITTHEDGSVQIHSYVHKDGFVLNWDIDKPRSEVIAWRPLPEPYREE
jgi:hypothetical protein